MKLNGIIFIGLVALATCLATFIGWFVPDDAFISYRYARNLADGFGLTFNPNEASLEGYSNFLWVIILACGSIFGITPDILAPILGVFFAVGTIALVLFFVSPIAALLVALCAPFTLYAASGMETPLWCLLLVATVIFIQRQKIGYAALISVFCALCRPEGIVVLFIVTGFALWKERGRNVETVVLYSVLAVIIYHFARLFYFGHFFPMSAGKFIDSIGRAKYAIGLWFIDGMPGMSPMGWYFVLIAFLAIVAGHYMRNAWTGFAAVFCVIGVTAIDWMPGARYLVPSVILFAIHIGDSISSRSGFRPAAILFILVNLSIVPALRADVRNRMSDKTDLETLVTLIPANTRTICTQDVGIIGYRTNLPVRDTWIRPLVSRDGPAFGTNFAYVLFSTDRDTISVQKDYASYLTKLRALKLRTHIIVPTFWTGRRPVLFTGP